jgi:hypothetical protein
VFVPDDRRDSSLVAEGDAVDAADDAAAAAAVAAAAAGAEDLLSALGRRLWRAVGSSTELLAFPRCSAERVTDEMDVPRRLASAAAAVVVCLLLSFGAFAGEDCACAAAHLGPRSATSSPLASASTAYSVPSVGRMGGCVSNNVPTRSLPLWLIGAPGALVPSPGWNGGGPTSLKRRARRASSALIGRTASGSSSDDGTSPRSGIAREVQPPIVGQ